MKERWEWWAVMLGVVVVGTLGPTAVARADVLELTTGERIEGRDARIGGDFVTLVVGERTIFLRRAEVRALYMGPPPAPCPKPS